ncbi:glycosyltransferase [Opitutus sp. ER46]|uniref:glycosyltransferase family 32 protein n=1 Tax=Opitutus sp. ER46 TaxID=2161864 RepID=UPI000D313DE3|nr:glycosyltransferase [Opitutus sp. ER46]PTX91654.1 hypothetical protein DB354_17445 [Opitutus sp. ER46]
MIPRIIHQTWKTRELTGEFAAYQASWRRLHPDWEYRFYDDADCRRLVAEGFPELLALYEALPRAVLRADLFRYLAVCRHGGIYADIDMECRKPHGPLLDRADLVLGVEETVSPIEARRLLNPYRTRIANCIFAAAPGHPYLRLAIDEIRQVAGRIDELAVVEATGPGLLTRLLHEHAAEFPYRLVPQICWTPPTRPPYPDLYPFMRHVWAIHHFAGTWKPNYRHIEPVGRVLRNAAAELRQNVREARSVTEVVQHLAVKIPPSPVWAEDLAFWRRRAGVRTVPLLGAAAGAAGRIGAAQNQP